MKQVFISNSALEAAGTAGTDRFADLVSKKLGFWTLDAATGGAWFATGLFGTDLEDGTDATSGDVVTIANGYMLKNKIQIVQGYGSGNPIATPIINSSDIVRVTAAHYEASTRHEVKITPNAGDIGSDVLNLKIIVRKQPTGYLDYVHNEAVIADLSGASKQFPLHVFNTTNHKVINISVDAGAAVENTVDNIITAISGNATLDAMFTTNDDTTHVDIVARHAGVVFEAILENVTDDRFTSSVVVAAFAPGTGNDWQARTDELQARAASHANYNRMYFPQTVTDFVADGNTFDRFEITYRIDGDRNVVKGSQFGTAVIYETTGTDSVKDVLNVGSVPVAGTPVEYLF